MRYVRNTTAILIFVLFAADIASGKIDKPRDESNQAKVLRYTTTLEQRPFDELAPAMRSWLISWITESPDVTVTVCDIFGPIPENDLPYGSELLVQSMFGNASHQIQNPSSAPNMLQMQLAGMKSLLKSYKSIIATKPESRIPYFDELLEKESSGNLQEYLSPLVSEKCLGSPKA